MKQVQAETGGRPFANDDLVVLQQELTDAVQAQFLGKGPFILSGCQVSGLATAATITAGILCLDRQLMRFAGQSGVSLPAQFQAGAVLNTDPRPYQTGGTKFCMREVPAVLVASNPAYSGGEFLPVDVWGGKRWADVQREQQWEAGDVKYSANLVATNYDSTGLGKPGTSAWGWALCNGQNGTADLRGQFVVGVDPSNADYDTPGKTGGANSVALSTAQLPAHSHTSSNRITNQNGGDAGSYTAALTASYGAEGKAITTNSVGGGQPIDARPPFYVLAVRQWVGL